jgi:hypothetical protein
MGFNVAKHCAVFLSRSTWAGNHHVIGHKAPVVVVRFNPFLYSKKDDQGVVRRNQVSLLYSCCLSSTLRLGPVPAPASAVTLPSCESDA